MAFIYQRYYITLNQSSKVIAALLILFFLTFFGCYFGKLPGVSKVQPVPAEQSAMKGRAGSPAELYNCCPLGTARQPYARAVIVCFPATAERRIKKK